MFYNIHEYYFFCRGNTVVSKYQAQAQTRVWLKRRKRYLGLSHYISACRMSQNTYDTRIESSQYHLFPTVIICMCSLINMFNIFNLKTCILKFIKNMKYSKNINIIVTLCRGYFYYFDEISPIFITNDRFLLKYNHTE